jgi:hypothetical protein
MARIVHEEGDVAMAGNHVVMQPPDGVEIADIDDMRLDLPRPAALQAFAGPLKRFGCKVRRDHAHARSHAISGRRKTDPARGPHDYG